MIRFAWREMVTAFRRRPWLMLCWLAVLSSCLMAMGWIQGFAEGARRAAAQIEPEHQIWAFARPDAEAKPLEDLLRRIGSLPSVERVRRLNAAEVRRRIAVELSSETSASDLPDGLLPQSIQITPVKSGVNPAVLEILRASEAIEWVDAGDIQVNQARARVRSLDRSAQALSLLLLVTFLLLGLGLGRLAMSLRRDEVSVMRLVGGAAGLVLYDALRSDYRAERSTDRLCRLSCFNGWFNRTHGRRNVFSGASSRLCSC